MKNENLAFVDTLRGLAAIYVFFVHFKFLGLHMTPVKVPRFADAFFGYGWSGVSLFFMLSAFTLCMSAESRRAEQHSIINFYIRRFFRIAPLFYFWIVLTCIRDHYVWEGLNNPFSALDI